MSSPLAQFTITGSSIFFGNYLITVWLQVVIISLIILLLAALLVSLSRWSLIFEVVQSSVNKLIKEQISGSLIYIPILLAIFLLVLISNLYGNIPHSYAITASAIVSLTLNIMLFIGVTILGIYLHKSNFLSFFIPEGTPWLLKPLLFLIEIVSYFSRSLSIGTRLIANITAGHTLLYTCSGLILSFITFSGLFGVLLGFPLITLFFAITGLELAVSFIQAFILLLLSSSYLKDAIF